MHPVFDVVFEQARPSQFVVFLPVGLLQALTCIARVPGHKNAENRFDLTASTRGRRPRYKRLHVVLGATWGPLASGGTPRGPFASRGLAGGLPEGWWGVRPHRCWNFVPSVGGAGTRGFYPGLALGRMPPSLEGGITPSLGLTPFLSSFGPPDASLA